MAMRWITALVEPPMAMETRMAFSKAAGFMICEGRMASWAMRTAWRPLISASCRRRLSGAGMAALPGRAIPRASAMLAMVEAVPMTMQLPAERQMASSTAPYSSGVIVPARSSAV